MSSKVDLPAGGSSLRKVTADFVFDGATLKDIKLHDAHML